MLRCLPAEEAFQQIHCEDFKLTDSFWHRKGQDGFGNRVVSGGTSDRHSILEYTSSGIVKTSTYCIPDANPHPMFRLPSPLTMPDEDMRMLMPVLTGDVLTDCRSIASRVHEHIDYTPGATTILTCAGDVFRLKRGVCQDYAHLMIALCRMAGLHARYVCGLMQGEGSTHAWVEVHDGQCWYAFDPTNNTAIATGYIKLAHGRDALDCPVSRGTYIGITTEEITISTKVV